MRSTAMTIATAAGALALAAAPALGAGAERFHDTIHQTSQDEICGFTGTTTQDGVVNVTILDSGTFATRTELTEVFTADAGGSLTLHSAQQNTGPLDPIDNGDGTVTFVQTFRGDFQSVRVTNGPLLLRNAGRMVAALTFDSDFNLISFDVLSADGPHPTAGDDPAFCAAVAPALG